MSWVRAEPAKPLKRFRQAAVPSETTEPYAAKNNAVVALFEREGTTQWRVDRELQLFLHRF